MTSSQPIRTLIVDDDPAVIRLHSAYLAGVEGFALAGTARSGAEAAGLAGDSSIDLVLLDMNLPDFSGIEVLHRLRVLREWDVDILVISSARDSFTVRQALAAHVAGYLVKPFTKQAFIERLEAYRATRRARTDETAQPLGQGDIDGILARRAGSLVGSGDAASRPAASPLSPLPKGLAESTMRLVLDALDPVTPRTAADIALDSGASRASVRRYLDHLSRVGVVDTSHRFGGRGRPEVLYRRVSD